MRWLLSLIWIGLIPNLALAQAPVFALSLKDAEKNAVSASNLLKAYTFDQEAARNQADAQFQNLLPKLSFQATSQYYANIPNISLGFGPGGLPFGTHLTYALGPTLNYTLWDSFSGKKSYDALSLLEHARHEDREYAELQLLALVRTAYVQVQLGIEELNLIQGSLALVRAQERDVVTRFRAGAAARLDVVTAERSVLSYEIQFQQRQAELSASLRDLMTLLEDPRPWDLSRPGPPNVPNVSLALQLEPLEQLLTAEGETIAPPGEDQPQIRSQRLQSGSFALNAESQKARLFPTLQLSAGVSYSRPDIPNPPSFWQETVGASLAFPLFLGDPTRDLAAQQRSQAEAASFRADQLRDNLERDFAKAREMLASLREQRRLAERDVSQSEEEAKLYYTSYKGGKINLIDVQNANNQALHAKVNAARIDAQILSQIIALKAISGKELSRE